MSDSLTLEKQILNQREQELLASVRKTSTKKIISSHCKTSYNKSSMKDSNIQSSIQRSGQIQERLLSLANEKQRKQQEQIEQLQNDLKKTFNQKKISNKSYKILIDKLEQSLNDNLNDIDREATGQLTFQQLGRLFTILEVFKIVQYNQDCQLEQEFYKQSMVQQSLEMQLHEVAWKVLANNQQVEYVDVKKIFCLFRISLDPAHIPVDKQTFLIKEYFEKIDSQSQDHLIKIIQEYCILFREQTQTRLANTKIGYLKPAFAKDLIETYQNTLTFKPQVDQVSEVLQGASEVEQLKPEQQELIKQYMQHADPQSQDDITKNRIELLLRKQDLYAMKKQILAQERDEAELSECTFKPVINTKSNNLNISQTTSERLLSYKTRFQVEQLQREAEEQRQLQLLQSCTFHPVLQESLNFQQNMFDVKAFDKSVQRMRMAIDMQNKKKIQKTYIPCGDQYENNKNLPFTSPAMLTRSKQESEQPVLQIHVNMGCGKVGKLSLKKDDDPVKVVKNFAKIWGISREDISDLLNRVNEEMNKIDDEVDAQE